MMKKILAFFVIFPLLGVGVAQAADCAEVGKHVADQQGGTLTQANLVSQADGSNVCVVVVLVPGRNGEKPRRVEVAVPAN